MARYDDMLPSLEDEDSEDEQVTGSAAHKAKPRRKSNQRPQGSDQIRQAFSKRKKGLVLKAYQLSALTDAKVFMFIVNDKGTSWAYATPGFGSSLNCELLKELRMLAQVPEQAKMVTEMMPDPPNAKAVDITGNSGLAVTRGADQKPGCITACTRAVGTLPTQSRSSCSGGSAAETGGAGDAAVNQMQMSMQCDQLSPTRLCARPPSSSAVAYGRSVPTSQLWQQHRSGVRLGASMEPPTPCGIYNLLDQPAAVAATESPTIISGLTAPATATSIKQLTLRYDTPVDSQLVGQTSWSAVAGTCIEQHSDQNCVQAEQALQHSCQQPAAVHFSTLHEGQQQEVHQAPAWSTVQQQHGELSRLQSDGWQAVDAAPVLHMAPGPHLGAEQQRPAGSGATEQPMQSTMHSSDAVMVSAAAAQLDVSSSTEGHHQRYAAPCESMPQIAADNSSNGLFENLLKDLPPLRVQRSIIHAGADGAHSAPGDGGGVHSQSLQWVDTSKQACQPPLRSASDVGLCMSSFDYSSYRNSPAPDQQGEAACSGPVDGLFRYPSAPYAMPVPAAVGLAGQVDPQSAASSPTAALSQQMVSLMAMESPAQRPSSSPGNLYQQAHPVQLCMGSQQQHQQQQFSAHYNLNSCIPRTDDLVADPLMDMLMDQALTSGLGPRTLPQQQQAQHTSHSQPYLLQQSLNHHQQQQQGLPGAQLQLYQRHDCTYNSAYGGGGHLQQSVVLPTARTPAVEMHLAHSLGAGQFEQQSSPNYMRMMELFKCMPLVSDPARKAWEDQVRQMKSKLAPHEQQEFAAWVRRLLQPRESSMAQTAAGRTSSGYAPRFSGVGGKQLHGPSRLSSSAGSATVTAAAAVNAAAPDGMPAGALLTTCGITPQSIGIGAGSTVPGSEHSAYKDASLLAEAGLGTAAMPPAVVTGIDQANRIDLEQMALLHDSSASASEQVRSQDMSAGPVQYAAAPNATTTLHAPVGDMMLCTEHCSSPLKRNVATFNGGYAGALTETGEVQEAMSPLKRSCRTLPEVQAPFAAERCGSYQSSLPAAAPGNGGVGLGSSSSSNGPVQACAVSLDNRSGLVRLTGDDLAAGSPDQMAIAAGTSAEAADEQHSNPSALC